MAKSTVDISALMERVDNIKENIGKMSEAVAKMEEKNEERYITKIEFYSEIAPIKKFVYSLVGVILISVIGALLSLVIIR